MHKSYSSYAQYYCYMHNHSIHSDYNQLRTQKLPIPRYCILGESIRKNPKIPSKVKIYFAELDFLSDKHRNIPYTIEEICDMKNLNIKTIKKWNEILCSEGFIKIEKEKLIILPNK